MNFKENESSTKLRGGYYTPEDVARFLARWVLVQKPRSILEPSCGDGRFIHALRGQHRHKVALTAIELIDEEADKSREAVEGKKLLSATIETGDFLAWWMSAIKEQVSFDAVLGNPPYIRYQYLEKRSQDLAERVFKGFNLPFTKHTNAWVPFVIASLALLNPGGRLGMVIPSEILHVLHAASLRRFLLEECDRILLIDPTELLFDDALQGTVLLMVEKKSDKNNASQGVAVVSAPDNTFLSVDPEHYFNKAAYVSGEILNGKWMKVLLERDELLAFEKARNLQQVRKFSDIASVDVGIVTGANKFFLVNDDTVKKYGLARFSKPMFGRSEHCPGIIYDDQTHTSNKNTGLAANFIDFGNTPLSRLPKKAKQYIELGEAEELHLRYKCRIRTPWYKVPSIYATEIGMLKRSHHYPRLILNTVGAYTTDTAYRIKTKHADAKKLVFCFINSLTALSAELEGRHYGGGVLELVPSEIEKLLIPLPDKLKFNITSLDADIRTNADPVALLESQDDIILKAIGLSKHECVLIQQAWRRVRHRRHRLLAE